MGEAKNIYFTCLKLPVCDLNSAYLRPGKRLTKFQQPSSDSATASGILKEVHCLKYSSGTTAKDPCHLSLKKIHAEKWGIEGIGAVLGRHRSPDLAHARAVEATNIRKNVVTGLTTNLAIARSAIVLVIALATVPATVPAIAHASVTASQGANARGRVPVRVTGLADPGRAFVHALTRRSCVKTASIAVTRSTDGVPLELAATSFAMEDQNFASLNQESG